MKDLIKAKVMVKVEEIDLTRKEEEETDLKVKEDNTNLNIKREDPKVIKLKEAIAFLHNHLKKFVNSRRMRSKNSKMKVSQ